MRAVELGGDVDGEIEIAEAFRTGLRIGRCDGEIAAEADDRLGMAVTHGRDALHHRVTVRAGRIEIEHLAEPIQHRVGRTLGDADRELILKYAHNYLDYVAIYRNET